MKAAIVCAVTGALWLLCFPLIYFALNSELEKTVDHDLIRWVLFLIGAGLVAMGGWLALRRR